MKKKSTAGETVCRNFCVYYKPAKNEELACRGLVVVQRLIEAGRAIPLARPEAAVPPDKRAEESLRQRLCRACDFRENDCDFILTGGNASPCGGFLLLVRLLGTGKITIEEIETA